MGGRAATAGGLRHAEPEPAGPNRRQDAFAGRRDATLRRSRVYTLPTRESPSFVTVKEKEKVDVLAHVVTPRAHMPRTPLLPPSPKKVIPKKKQKEAKIPPVPMPKPPPLPADWQDLSKTESEEAEEPADAPPTPTDEWSLVRTAGGAGRLDAHALARHGDSRRSGAICRKPPDCLLLFAGKRARRRSNKNIWLWTTIGGGSHAYDFDNFRVFIWSLRRHRYETSYIERNLTGFEPVTLKNVTFAGAQYPGFSVCIQKKDGLRYRREYALLSNVIRFAGERALRDAEPRCRIWPRRRPRSRPAHSLRQPTAPRPPNHRSLSASNISYARGLENRCASAP